jgi:hypothetical protein
VGAAKLRIQWLEGIIRDRLPDVNLTAGPQIDLPIEPTGPSSRTVVREDVSDKPPVEVHKDQAEAPSQLSHQRSSLKRRAESSSQATGSDGAIFQKAYSVAKDLGMLSLNSDSSQKHYIGSSSGLLFANLIGASPSSDNSSRTPEAEVSTCLVNDYSLLGSHNSLRKTYCSGLAFLRQV